MVGAQAIETDLLPRRSATIGFLDARLSVWGQAAREAAARRAEVLIEGAVAYAERVGRPAEALAAPEGKTGSNPLLAADPGRLVELAAVVVPGAVRQSCRLLWVDPERLRERLAEALAPSVEGARAEVRRLQALYRRRARLWKDEQERLDTLRDEVESLRVPRTSPETAAFVTRGLLELHLRQSAGLRGPSVVADNARLEAWLAQLG